MIAAINQVAVLRERSAIWRSPPPPAACSIANSRSILRSCGDSFGPNGRSVQPVERSCGLREFLRRCPEPCFRTSGWCFGWGEQSTSPSFLAVFALPSIKNCCAYSKPKSGRTDDAAPQGLESLRCGRSSASARNLEQLYPTRDRAGLGCNTRRKSSGRRAGVLRRTPPRWSRDSRRIALMSRSTCPFCRGERGAVGRSRIPIARMRWM